MNRHFYFKVSKDFYLYGAVKENTVLALPTFTGFRGSEI